MPRKRFEEQPYDPIAADLVREVTAAGRTTAAAPAEVLRFAPRPVPVVTEPLTVSPVVAAPPPAAMSFAVPRPAAPAPAPAPKASSITKRFVLTRTEDDDLNAFLLRLQQRAGAKVTVCVFVRALVTLAMQAEHGILRELDGRALKFPSTHDRLGQGFFEEQWQQCLASALTRPDRPRA